MHGHYIVCISFLIGSLPECAIYCGQTTEYIIIALMEDNCYLCFTDGNQGDLIDFNSTTNIVIWHDTLMSGM